MMKSASSPQFYNYPGCKKAVIKNKVEATKNVNRRCYRPNCSIPANFGTPGQYPTSCHRHKKEDEVNVLALRCIRVDCWEPARFGRSKKPIKESSDAPVQSNSGKTATLVTDVPIQSNNATTVTLVTDVPIQSNSTTTATLVMESPIQSNSGNKATPVTEALASGTSMKGSKSHITINTSALNQVRSKPIIVKSKPLYCQMHRRHDDVEIIPL